MARRYTGEGGFHPFGPTRTSVQEDWPSVDVHRRLKAFFLGDSKITPPATNFTRKCTEFVSVIPAVDVRC